MIEEKEKRDNCILETRGEDKGRKDEGQKRER